MRRRSLIFGGARNDVVLSRTRSAIGQVRQDRGAHAISR